MEQVFVADNPVQARLMAGYLQSQGIPAEVRGDLLWSVAVEFIFAKGAAPSVWVPKAHAIAAREAIRLNDAADDEENWTCPNCGEVQGGQFSHCWQCGTPPSQEDNKA